MPNGCTLIFEPFAATSVHEPLGLVAGNIYGQSTVAVEMPDGTCKHLIARPTFANPDDTGDIVTMVCNRQDGSVITAEPTFDERGNIVWQEVDSLSTDVCVAENGIRFKYPTSVSITYPCSIATFDLSAPATFQGGSTSPDAERQWVDNVVHDILNVSCSGEGRLSLRYRARTTTGSTSMLANINVRLDETGEGAYLISLSSTFPFHPRRVFITGSIGLPNHFAVVRDGNFVWGGFPLGPAGELVVERDNVIEVFLRGSVSWPLTRNGVVASSTKQTMRPGESGSALGSFIGPSIIYVKVANTATGNPQEGVDFSVFC